MELEAILKRYNVQVKFFKGSPMHSRDLDRVYLSQADCCLVLANKYSSEPDSEDAANIMRVISIKNYCSEIKIIIQLIQYHNKAYLLNIPNWKMLQGDEVICMAELKLGFIAVSCLAPGFSTLIANLFTMRAFKSDSRIPTWQNEYMEGAGMELYSEYFSSDFLGLSFHEAVILAYEKLDLLLIGIQADHGIVINPSRTDMVISNPCTQGFFIAQSSDEVKRAFYYCGACHSGLASVLVRPCHCESAKRARSRILADHMGGGHHHRRGSNSSGSNKSISAGVSSPRSLRRQHSLVLSRETDVFLKLPSAYTSTGFQDSTKDPQQDQQHQPADPTVTDPDGRLNITGSFYWCPDTALEDAILTPQRLQDANLQDHILVCLFAEQGSPLIGLRNFLFPLRSASNAGTARELCSIVLIGSLEYIRREWKTLHNFPRLHVMPGSPLNRVVLRSVRLERCRVCVILSAKQSASVDDHSLVDKEAILCSLNIKAMQFPHPDPHPQAPTQRAQWRDGTAVPIITELAIDSNVQFLDQDDDDDPDCEIFMSQPFACASVFTVSVLDSMMSTAYFNEDALSLIRIIVCGGMTLEFEQLLAEGTGFRGSPPGTKPCFGPDSPCRLHLLPVNKPPLSQCRYPSSISGHAALYGELVINSVRLFGIVCIGVFRRIDSHDQNQQLSLTISTTTSIREQPAPASSHRDSAENSQELPGSNKRYVITNPCSKMVMFSADLIYCLICDHRAWHTESDS